MTVLIATHDLSIIQQKNQNPCLVLEQGYLRYDNSNNEFFITAAPFWVRIHYVLKSVLEDLWRRKFATLITILVIAVSTILTVSYLLRKNAAYCHDTILSGKGADGLFTQKFK